MNRLKSAFLARSPMFFSTNAASISIVSPNRSDAVKLTSSRTRSITVCRRRAPIFSTEELTCTAIRATALIASGVNESSTPSVRRSASYWLTRLASGLGEDAAEIVLVQGRELDPYRQPALQFGQQIRGFRRMEGARGDEQNVIGLHRAMLGRDRGALDQRKQIALHALARDIAAATPSRAQILSISSRNTIPLFSTSRIAS